MGNGNTMGNGGDSLDDIHAQQAIRAEANYGLSLVEAGAIRQASGSYLHLYPETTELDDLTRKVEENAYRSLALNHQELLKVRTRPRTGRVAAILGLSDKA